MHSSNHLWKNRYLYISFLWLLFWDSVLIIPHTHTHQPGLEFRAILLPQPTKCWDYKFESPCLFLFMFHQQVTLKIHSSSTTLWDTGFTMDPELGRKNDFKKFRIYILKFWYSDFIHSDPMPSSPDYSFKRISTICNPLPVCPTMEFSAAVLM